MSDLRQRLARLGLSQYLDAFTAEGFDTWETVLDITESDLSLLNVKLGHRRKLQRAIAESRGQTSDRPLPISLGRAGSAEASYRSGDESATETNRKQGETNTNGAGVKGTATKRKYRRHPKPDEHAPERPPSAYVIFSNQIRELLKGQELSFTEIAKVVGERWQVLPAEERETCERQANTAKEKYYAELADYKKTPQYEAYQKYLEDFKAKHAVPTKGPYYHCMPPSITELTGLEGKRSKLETETSTSTRSSSHDQHERASNRRLSEVQPDPSLLGLQGTEASPPIVPGRLPPGSSFLSKPTSPASHATLNSPRTIDHYSPISASPRSSLFDISSAIPSRDSRGPPEANYPYLPSAYSHPPMQQPASTTPPSYPSTTRYQAPLDLPSRRSMREPTRLPPLTREDTTWSSESGQSGSGYSITPSLFPGSVLPLDPQKTMRMLPQPVPSIGPLALLDRPPPAQLAQLSGHPPDYRTQGSLAALVRAGELAARVADEEAMDVEGSSISP